jgi:uncharacterized membrane protein
MKSMSKSRNEDELEVEGHDEGGKAPLKILSEALGVPEEELKQKLKEKKIPKPLRRVLITGTEFSYEGALPPPEWANAYEKLHKGSFKKILSMYEGVIKHKMEINRHEMEIEKETIPELIGLTKRNHTKAFIITLICLGIVILCVFYKQEILGSVIGGLTLINLVNLFLRQKLKEKVQKKTNNTLA